MQKKWRDRLPCLHSTIPKSFSFSESDRRGVSANGTVETTLKLIDGSLALSDAVIVDI